SLPLDFAAVFSKAHQADYWLTSTFGTDLTLSDMKSSYPLNAEMKAFSSGGVYNVNTESSEFYDEFPFHPELLLNDYINIFHPGILDNQELRYYRQVQ
ncbi:MAG: ABC transporter substrate-binding protein, partial [Muribaculaceae bacterium]|nr:ABC transporter substrate-binding protein [Muribaculaceae bacterium]